MTSLALIPSYADCSCLTDCVLTFTECVLTLAMDEVSFKLLILTALSSLLTVVRTRANHSATHATSL